MRRSRAWLLGGGLLALVPPTTWGADDDLSIVKKAMAANIEASGGTETRAPLPPHHRVSEPRWLRVRITDKGEKRPRVSINLPLSLVRAMGDEVPLDWHCRKEGGVGEKHGPLRLSALLERLESGQDIVLIDGEDATVRVYVE